MKTFFRDLFWVFLSCGLWAASFHPLDLWPLAWIALVPAFVRIGAAEQQNSGTAEEQRNRKGKRRLGLVWVIAQYFLHVALMGWTGVIAPLLAFLVPLLGVPFSWLTGFLLQRGIVRLRLPVLFVGPLAIVVVEVLRDQALTGLSWASIGYSQWRWLDLVQLASVGRVHLVSLAVVVANAGIATAIQRWRAGAPVSARLRPIALAAAVVLAFALVGHAIRPSGFEEGPLAAGLQPNISQAQRMQDRGHDGRVRHLQNHAELVARVRDLHPDLLVYSETSFPYLTEPPNSLASFLSATIPVPPAGRLEMPSLVLQGKDQVTILGLVRRQKLPPSEVGGPRDDDADGFDETNVAWVVKGGAPTDTIYEKRGLAPFGEYVPIPRGWPGRDLLIKQIERAAHFVPDLNPGKDEVLFDVGSKKGGLTICFEMVFPWYYRESVLLGADFHVNISNDAWFDGSCELALVDVAGIFRAVESGRSLFRVSNSGISTLIGPDGTRLAWVEEGGRRTQVRGTLHGKIPIGRGRTGYVACGDLPWILPSLALLLGFLLATIRLKRNLPGLMAR